MANTKIVLIIDDDPAIRRAIARALRNEFDIIIEAKHGKEAEGFLCAKISLILSDITMPIMAGHEFHQRHAAFLRKHSIGFVALSGGTTLPGALEYLKQAEIPLLNKPCNRATLLEAVRTHNRP